MTKPRPLDADGNPPMPGQMDIADVVSETMRANVETETEARIHNASRDRLARPMTAAEIVAGRLRGTK